MKKSLVFLLLIVFFLCAGTGFVGAKKLARPLSRVVPTPTPQPETAAPAQSHQRNFLLIHIDDLNSPQPMLISLWMAFQTLYDSPSLTFKALYPNPLDSNAAMVTAVPVLAADGRPSAAFLEALSGYQVKWNGYFLLDQQAVRALSAALGTETQAQVIDPARIADLALSGLEAETLLLQGACHYLSNKELRAGKAPSWKELIPAHFRTDLDFEEVMVNWDRLAGSALPPHCEIIAVP